MCCNFFCRTHTREFVPSRTHGLSPRACLYRVSDVCDTSFSSSLMLFARLHKFICTYLYLIRNMKFYNVFGTPNLFLHLVARHCIFDWLSDAFYLYFYFMLRAVITVSLFRLFLAPKTDFSPLESIKAKCIFCISLVRSFVEYYLSSFFVEVPHFYNMKFSRR